MATIYAVVTLTKPINQFSCHVYSKQTSNIDIMQAYKEEIERKRPNSQVLLTSRENAKKIESDYYKWFKEWERACYNRTRKPMGKVAIEEYKELMEKR